MPFSSFAPPSFLLSRVSSASYQVDKSVCGLDKCVMSLLKIYGGSDWPMKTVQRGARERDATPPPRPKRRRQLAREEKSHVQRLRPSAAITKPQHPSSWLIQYHIAFVCFTIFLPRRRRSRCEARSGAIWGRGMMGILASLSLRARLSHTSL